MDQLIFQSNFTWLWLVLFGVIAMFFSVFLYYKEQNLTGPNWLKPGLGILRFLTLFLLLCLFIEPFMVRNSVDLEKPGLILLTDNSASMLLHQDSIQTKNLNTKITALESQLKEKYQVFRHQFSSDLQDSLTFDFQGTGTDAYAAFSKIKQRYYQEPVNGMVFISDGIFNSGFSPEIIAEQFTFPIYSVGIGDSIAYPDIKIVDVKYNDYSFLGNTFPVSVLINAKSLKGRKGSLKVISSSGKPVYTEEILIEKETFSQNIQFSLEAEEVGVQTYRISLETIGEERNTENNQSVFGVEVIDSRKKMLILADGPHPDIGVVRDALTDNRDLELQLKGYGDTDFIDSLKNFDLVWMYQPKGIYPERWIQEIRAQKLPYLVQLGTQTDYGIIRKNFSSPRIKLRNQVMESFTYAENEEFDYFKLGKETEAFLESCPPLKFPLATIQFDGQTAIQGFQNVDGIQTENPLIAFSKDGELKTAWIFGEGLWKWRMNNYRKDNSFNHFAEWVDKTIQYLSVKKDRRRLRVKIPKKVVGDKPVVFQAEFYNESYELDNSPDLVMNLEDKERKQFSFHFNRREDDYALRFSGLEAGEYSYIVKAETEEKIQTSGKLWILRNELEKLETRSDFNQLYTLSSLNGGQLYYQKNWESLTDFLVNKEVSKIRYDRRDKTLLQEMPWLLYLLLGLLFTEWFLRKFFGTL